MTTFVKFTSPVSCERISVVFQLKHENGEHNESHNETGHIAVLTRYKKCDTTTFGRTMTSQTPLDADASIFSWWVEQSHIATNRLSGSKQCMKDSPPFLLFSSTLQHKSNLHICNFLRSCRRQACRYHRRQPHRKSIVSILCQLLPTDHKLHSANRKIVSSSAPKGALVRNIYRPVTPSVPSLLRY
jgi:hypothetical protein